MEQVRSKARLVDPKNFSCTVLIFPVHYHYFHDRCLSTYLNSRLYTNHKSISSLITVMSDEAFSHGICSNSAGVENTLISPHSLSRWNEHLLYANASPYARWSGHLFQMPFPWTTKMWSRSRTRISRNIWLLSLLCTAARRRWSDPAYGLALGRRSTGSGAT